MKDIIIVNCLFGVTLGILGIAIEKVRKSNKKYRIIMNIIFYLVVISSIYVNTGLSKTNHLIGIIVEIGIMLLVGSVGSKLIKNQVKKKVIKR